MATNEKKLKRSLVQMEDSTFVLNACVCSLMLFWHEDTVT